MQCNYYIIYVITFCKCKCNYKNKKRLYFQQRLRNTELIQSLSLSLSIDASLERSQPGVQCCIPATELDLYFEARNFIYRLNRSNTLGIRVSQYGHVNSSNHCCNALYNIWTTSFRSIESTKTCCVIFFLNVYSKVVKSIFSYDIPYLIKDLVTPLTFCM